MSVSSAEAIFLALADLSADERVAFLDERCGHDRQLRSEVDALLAALDSADEGFLDPARVPALDMTLRTGPKTSVRASSLAGSTLASTVGRTKLPFAYPSTRALRPSTSGFAPAATPCAISASMRVRLSAEITGPISVPLSRP